MSLSLSPSFFLPVPSSSCLCSSITLFIVYNQKVSVGVRAVSGGFGPCVGLVLPGRPTHLAGPPAVPVRMPGMLGMAQGEIGREIPPQPNGLQRTRNNRHSDNHWVEQSQMTTESGTGQGRNAWADM